MAPNTITETITLDPEDFDTDECPECGSTNTGTTYSDSIWVVATDSGIEVDSGLGFEPIRIECYDCGYEEDL